MHSPEIYPVVEAVENALEEVSYAEERMRARYGADFDHQFNALRMSLQSIRDAAQAHQSIDATIMHGGLTRWLTDWIPDLTDPLVEAVGTIQTAAAACTNIKRS